MQNRPNFVTFSYVCCTDFERLLHNYNMRRKEVHSGSLKKMFALLTFELSERISLRCVL